MAASKLVSNYLPIFFSDVCLEEEKEYKNYLMMTPECFDKLFVLLKDDIRK